MIKTAITAVVLVLLAPMALAEGTKADWDRLAEPIVAKFGGCAWTEVDRTWETTEAPKEIATEAVATCEHQLDPLEEILAAEPFRAGEEEIAATLEQIKGEVRDAAQADIEKRRKE